MAHTTDIDAIEAELEALLADTQAQDARINALLAQTGSTAVRLADTACRLQQGARELAAQERYQRRISRALDAMGA